MWAIVFFYLLWIRFDQIGIKPFHHDETINYWFVLDMWKSGFYKYDPSNYHGPFLFYIFQWAEGIFPGGINTFRLVTVLFSVMTLIHLFKWFYQRFGLSRVWLLGLLLSPGYLFFSRSAIHETPFVFFSALMMTSFIDFIYFKKQAGFRFFLIGLLGSALLKETFVFNLIGAAIILINKLFLASASEKEFFKASLLKFKFDLVLFFILFWLFFTGFGANAQGFFDFFKAFMPWFKTSVSGGHEKPIYYFLILFFKNEPATIAMLALSIWGLFKAGSEGLVRWVSFWSLFIFTIYSLIPYKTPWCLISIQVPLWISGAVVLVNLSNRYRKWVTFVLLLLSIKQVYFFNDLNFEHPTQKHDYVYVQTHLDAKVFAESLILQVQKNPSLARAKVQWGTAESWPFPSWLNLFVNQKSALAPEFLESDFDLLLVDFDKRLEVEKKLKGHFLKKEFNVRDARQKAVAYFKKGVFTCPFNACEEFLQ